MTSTADSEAALDNATVNPGATGEVAEGPSDIEISVREVVAGALSDGDIQRLAEEEDPYGDRSLAVNLNTTIQAEKSQREQNKSAVTRFLERYPRIAGKLRGAVGVYHFASPMAIGFVSGLAARGVIGVAAAGSPLAAMAITGASRLATTIYKVRKDPKSLYRAHAARYEQARRQRDQKCRDLAHQAIANC